MAFRRMISRSASTSYGLRPSRRMDLFEVGERLAQIYASAGRPDDLYGACHLLALNYHWCYDGRGKGTRVSDGGRLGLARALPVLPLPAVSVWVPAGGLSQ